MRFSRFRLRVRVAVDKVVAEVGPKFIARKIVVEVVIKVVHA